MRALEIVEDRDTKEPAPQLAKALLEAAKDEGLLIGLGGLHGQVIRIGPSLLITEAEVAEGLDRLGRACERV
jgi:4-aminobutyrate aminotransferase-like enzyme